MGCICEVADNPLRSGIPGVIALLKGPDNPVARGIDSIQACPYCKKYTSDAEAAFTYYSLSAPAQLPQIKPEDHLDEMELQFLISGYEAQPFPVDRLPYTNVFEAMVRYLNEFRRVGQPERTPLSNFMIFSILMALRKQERLPYKK